MRFSPPTSARTYALSIAAVWVVTASAPVTAETGGATDDSTKHRVASAISSSAFRAGRVDRAVPDAARFVLGDTAAREQSLLVPYRESTSSNASPSGFSMPLPSTDLALTNGSAWLRRSNDARHPTGVRISIQLTY